MNVTTDLTAFIIVFAVWIRGKCKELRSPLVRMQDHHQRQTVLNILDGPSTTELHNNGESTAPSGHCSDTLPPIRQHCYSLRRDLRSSTCIIHRIMVPGMTYSSAPLLIAFVVMRLNLPWISRKAPFPTSISTGFL